MAVDPIESGMNRLRLMYYKKGIPIKGNCISNYEKMLSYMQYRMNEGLAPNTILNDVKALIEFSKVINTPFEKLKPDDVYKLFSFLNNKSKGTAGLYKLKIKAFLKFIGREDLAQIIVVKQSLRDRKLPEDLLTPEDVERLISATNNIRDKAYIAVLYESGARKGELEELQLKHVVFDENGAVVTLPKGKTGARRVRVVFAAGYLRNWYEIHPVKENRDAWLWASTRGEHQLINYKTMWKTLQKSAEKAGIQKRVNPHSFRHARATHLAKDLTEQQLKAYLGWTAGSQMAGIYVHLSGKDMDQAILKLHGLATDEMKEDNALKTVKCPRCKEIQDKKAIFCYKCGLPLTKEYTETIESNKNVITELVLQLQNTDPKILNVLLETLKTANS